MDPQNKANCEKLLVEIRSIGDRLKQISDASYGDMEGADAPDFFISEELFCGCDRAARVLASMIKSVERLIAKG